MTAKGEKTFLINTSLVVAAVLVAFVAAETVVRIFKYIENKKYLSAEVLQESALPREQEESKLRDIIRLSSGHDIIYELKQNLETMYYGARITTNAEGWRDVDYPLKKGEKTIRIIGLGDSIMFGQGVADGDDFTAQLESRLNNTYNAKQWEIINTAVPGYNTAMQVATLKAKGLKYKPDIVLIMFIGNDIELPNFIGTKEDLLSLRTSFLIDLFVARYQKRKDIERNVLIESPQADGEKWFENDPDKVPEEYRHMVGIQGYRKAMAELCELSKEHGFEIIVCSDAPIPDSIRSICTEMNLEIVNAYEGILDFMREKGIAERGEPPLTVSKEDMHPSRLAHKIIADYYFQYFEDHIVKKYL
jgi:hypothetical protein